MRKTGYIFTEEHKRKLRAARAKRIMPLTKGGRTQHVQGYIYVRAEGHPRATKKGHYVFEHILVMEKHLGRYLQGKEEIDHINGVKDDNRIENLRLFQNHHDHLVEEGKRGIYKKDSLWRSKIAESHKIAYLKRFRNELGQFI